MFCLIKPPKQHLILNSTFVAPSNLESLEQDILELSPRSMLHYGTKKLIQNQ